MSENQFMIKLNALLDKQKSKTQINSDIKELQSVINKIKLIGTFSKGSTKAELNAVIQQMETQLKQIKLSARLDSRQLNREINNTLRNVSARDIQLNLNSGRFNMQLRRLFSEARSFAERNTISFNVDLKKEKLQNQLTTFLGKHTKINESSYWINEAERLRTVIGSITNRDQLRSATDQLNVFTSGVRATGYATISTTDRIKTMLGQVFKVGNYFGLAYLAINKFRQSLSNLKEHDTILTEISKTSDMTRKQLSELGNEAFETASKFGQLAKNYLTSVQEMARSGYEKQSKQLGELSLLAQSAGDMTDEMANNFILATDAAYQYGGSIEKLNGALDGANYISNKNSASLTDLADGIRVSASYAAGAGVAIDELTAAEGTMVAVTKRSGSEIGRAFRSILLNLQQVSGEFEGEVIDEEQLKKVEERCHSLGVELETMKNGVATLRNPMEVLKELSEVYNSLPENSADKQGLIADLGGKYHANSLSALLKRWDLYEKMLSEFSQGSGSALQEAEKTADSWAGRVNHMENTWNSFVNSLVSKDAIKGGVSFLDNTIQAFQKLTDGMGAIPVILTTINAGMASLNKNYGITQLTNAQTGKIDVQGSFMGFDITAIKAQKKHFEEATTAIEGWNAKLRLGQTDINDFTNATVQNNAQLKAYLQTTSTQAPASLNGYKASLQAAGVVTDALRLKTILLTASMSMGLGLAIQAVISGVTKLLNANKQLREDVEQTISEYQQSSKTIKENGAWLKDNISTYAELSRSIGRLGENTGLTEDEFSKFNDISNQIASMFPSLISGWTEQGTAILSCRDNLDLLNEAYRTAQTNSAIEFINDKNTKKLLDVYQDDMNGSGIFASAFGYEQKLNILTELLDNISSVEDLEKSISGMYSDPRTYGAIMPRSEYLEGFGFQIDSHGKLIDTDKISEEMISNLLMNLRAEKSNLESSMSAGLSPVKELAESYLTINLDNIEGNLSEQGKTIANKFTQGITNGITESFGEDEVAVQTYVNKIVNALKDNSDNQEVKNAMVDLFNLNSDISPTETKKIVDDYIKIISEYLTQDENELKIGLGFDEVDDLASKYENAIQSAKDRFDGEDLTLFFNENSINTQEEIDKWIEIANECSTATEAKKKYLGLGNNNDSLSFTDAISQVQALSKGLDQLDKIYADVSDKEDFDWSSILNNDSFNETFGSLGSAYDDFIQTVSNTPDDISACQDAFDSLATSYINQSDILNQVTEETKASTIAMLEQMGIANALDLVENSLSLQKQFLAVTGTDLANATYEEINAFLAESDAADDTKQALAAYQLQKELAAGLTLDTSGDIQNLENLVTACGGAAKALSALNKIKSGDTSQFMYGGKENYNALVGLAEKEVQDALRDVQNSSASVSNKAIYSGGASTKKAADSAKKASESAKEAAETFNWIETAISRIQRAITNLGKTVSASYLSWSKRNSAVTSELSAVTKEISLQQSAYQKYMELANGSGLSDAYKNLVQNGSLSVEDIADDTLKEQIKTYQDYYEKALDASDAVQDLRDTLADLAKTRFDNLTAQYEAKISDIDHLANLINGQITNVEARNKIAGKSFYESLMEQERQKLEMLSAEREAQINALNDAVSGGMVEYGSEDWYDMKSDIDSVTESIQEAENNIIDFGNSMKQVAKLNFDDLSEQFSNAIGLVTDASDVFSGYIDQAEAAGSIAGTSFYKALLEAKDTEADALRKKYETLSSTFADAMADGSVQEFSPEWYEMKKSISDTESAIVSADTAMIELKNSIREVAKLRFDDLVSQFDNAVGLVTGKIDAVDKYISMTEESGYMAGTEYYETLMDAEKGRIDALSKEYTRLSDSLSSALADGSVEEYDDNWYEMMESIQGVEDSLIDANTALIQYGNSMRQVQWDIFDRMQDSVSGLADESGFLIDLMSRNHELYDDYGNMNERGLSVQGLHAVNYDLYLKQAQEYADEIREINGQLADDPSNMTLLDRYNELLSMQHDSILNAEEEKSAIQDLISNGYDLMLSSLNELIDKRKEALRAEKDLYDYEKKVSKQSDAVASYEKQLQAYAGDDSEEMKATIQKVQQNLISAQEELSETEYEKYISDQEALLDNLYTQMEEWVNLRLDDINGLISQAIDATNANAATISGQISADVNGVGAVLSQNMNDIWYSTGNGHVVSRFNMDFDEKMFSVKEVVDGIKNNCSNMAVMLQQSKATLESTQTVLNAVRTKTESIEPNVSEIAQSTKGMIGGISSVEKAINLVKGALDGIKSAVEKIRPTTVVNNYTSDNSTTNNTTTNNNTGGDQTVQTNNTGGQSSSSKNKDTSKNKGKSDKEVTSATQNKDGTWNPNSTSHGSNNTVYKYGSGTDNAAPGDHIVSEDGDEVIIDNNGNAMVAKGKQLYHFEGGEVVLNHKETETLVNNAGKMTPFSEIPLLSRQDILNLPNLSRVTHYSPTVPEPPTANSETRNVTNDIHMELSFPGVKNYEEMVKKMQTDRRFETIVQEMTLGRAMGRNSYSKMKY